MDLMRLLQSGVSAGSGGAGARSGNVILGVRGGEVDPLDMLELDLRIEGRGLGKLRREGAGCAGLPLTIISSSATVCFALFKACTRIFPMRAETFLASPSVTASLQ